MPPPDGLFDFYRRYAMKGDMADVMHVPLEAAEAVQHAGSIYECRIYSQCPAGRASRNARRSALT